MGFSITGSRTSFPILYASLGILPGTGRWELGYHVTLVRDATAPFSKDRMHAAHELNGPHFAPAILTTAELAVALPHE